LVLTVAVALGLGWLTAQEHPLGYVFSSVYKIWGYNQPKTVAVPDDQKPEPRPQGEMFLTLLGHGDQMPMNGLGMCCRPTAYDDESVYNTVLWYFLQGGRLIDTAALYLNHKPIGKAIKEAIKRGVPRSEMFITTKVPGESFGYESITKKVPQMLKELDLDYLDLVLMHAPRKLGPGLLWSLKFPGESDEFSSQSCKNQVQCRKETWQGLSEAREKGLVRNVGVSNFKINHLQEIEALNLAPIAVNQIQYHPWAPEWLKETIEYCHQKKIAVTGYFSLGGAQTKDKAMEQQALNDIAKVHNRRTAQILLRWSLQKNVSIIPGTGKPPHMKENLATYGFELTDEQMKTIDGMSSLPISDDFFFFDI